MFMAETDDALAAMETRRKKARFRAWHRGMREMDLILGNFADEAIASINADELDEFERILQLPDSQLLKWFTGAEPIPAANDTELIRQISTHRRYEQS
jgi:antitoxin CptB